MPLETFPLLRDNTRLIKHGDTLYKLKVKYDIDSFKNEDVHIAEAVAHSEIEQVFRAVVYMIERKENPKPILTNHFQIQVQVVQWSFLKKYKNLVFTKDNKVLKVHDHLLEFVVKKNVVDKVPVCSRALCKPQIQDKATISTKDRGKQINIELNVGENNQKEKNITRNKNDSSDGKRRKTDGITEAVVAVYSKEKSDTNQCGSRFYRDEKGRMCRLVQSSTEKLNENPASVSPADLVSQQDGHSSFADDRFTSSPSATRHQYVVKKKPDHSRLTQHVNISKYESRHGQFSQEKPSLRGQRHSERLKTLPSSARQQDHRTSKIRKEHGRKNMKPNPQHEYKDNKVKNELSSSQGSGSEFDSQTDSENGAIRRSRRHETKRKSKQLESQSGSQTETEIDTDNSEFEPVSKKLKLRRSCRISDRQNQNSSVHWQEAARNHTRALRRSERLTRYKEDQMSSESEEEMRANKSNNATGQESDDSVKQRKRKLYAAHSSPQLITNSAPVDKLSLSSPRISTVRPVKRDNVGTRGQHASPRRPDLISSTRVTRLQMQEEETQRMEQLRNPVGSPIPRYRDLLHNRRDRHTVEQAEREETTKLRQLYEPTAPRRSPRVTSESTRRRSSGLWGKFMETIVTPTKNLFVRK